MDKLLHPIQHVGWNNLSISKLLWSNLTGELWGVYYEKFEENWPRYNDTALYIEIYWVIRILINNHIYRKLWVFITHPYVISKSKSAKGYV